MIRLRWSLLLLVSSIVLSLSIFVLIITVSSLRQEKSAQQANLVQTSRALSLAVDRELAGKIAVLRVLAVSKDIDADNLRGFYDQAQVALKVNPGWDSIVLISRSGEMLVNLQFPFGTRGALDALREDQIEVFKTAQPVVSNLFTGKLRQQPLIGVAVPVIRGGEVKYLLGLSASPEFLVEILSRQRVPVDWQTTVLDKKKTIIASNRGMEKFFGKPAPRLLAVKSSASSEEIFPTVADDQASMYTAFHRSNLSGWTLAVAIPAGLIDAPLRRAMTTTAATGLLFLLLGTALAAVWAKRISSSASALIAAARALGRGEPFQPGRAAIVEFDQVGREIELAAAARNRMEEALRETETRYRELVESVQAIVWRADVKTTRFTYVSKQAETILGYPVSRWTLEPTFWPDHMHPDDQSWAVDYCVNAAREKRAYDFEYRMIAADGRTVWIRDIVRVIAAGDTPVELIGVMIDFTEQKRNQEALQWRHQQLQTLHAISEHVFKSTQLSAVLQGTLDETLSLGNLDIGVIRLREPGSSKIIPVALRGYRQPEAVNEHLIDLENPESESFHYRVIVNKQSSLTEDISTTPGFRLFKKEGVQSAILVPILAGGELLGSLQLGSRVQRHFAPELIQTLEVVANQMGVAVQKARLFQETQNSLERLRTLLETNKAVTSTLDLQGILNVLLEKLALFLPIAALTTVRLKDRVTGALEPLACRGLDLVEWRSLDRQASSDTARIIAETRTPLALSYLKTDAFAAAPLVFHQYGLVSYLGVPMNANNETIGVLGLYTRREYEFSKDEIDFLNTLAAQAAVAIHNAQLFEAVKRANEEAKMLREINLAITSSLDLHTQMYLLLDKTLPLFANSAVTLRLLDKETGDFPALACRNLDENEWKSLPPKIGMGGLYQVIASRQPLTIVDAQHDARMAYPDFLRRNGLISYLGVPLMFENEVLGVLGLFTRERQEFTEGEKEFISILAKQAAIAIHNSQLYERMRLQALELEKAKNLAEAANRAKTEFLGVVSHELRTPLHVMMGYVRMLKEGLLGGVTQEQEGALRKILDSSADQLRMINEVLVTTDLESRATFVDWQCIDLADFFAHLKSDFDAMRDSQQPALVWDYPEEPARLVTDALKLRQIMQNLVGNALKFTASGKVAVSVKTFMAATGARSLAANGAGAEEGCNRWVEIKVSDTGAGIPADKLEVIFDKFYQLDASTSRSYGGLGLGLYIAKQFTELLGGKIGIESELGRGSVVTVSIPIGI